MSAHLGAALAVWIDLGDEDRVEVARAGIAATCCARRCLTAWCFTTRPCGGLGARRSRTMSFMTSEGVEAVTAVRRPAGAPGVEPALAPALHRRPGATPGNASAEAGACHGRLSAPGLRSRRPLRARWPRPRPGRGRRLARCRVAGGVP